MTLQPLVPLVSSTIYTAVVSGAKDANGFTMAAPFKWTFATASATVLSGQYTIWNSTAASAQRRNVRR